MTQQLDALLHDWHNRAMPESLPGVLTREVAAILRGRQARIGISQRDLAYAAKISQSQLSKVLRGIKPIDLDLLDRLTSTLGLGMSEVVSEADEMTVKRLRADRFGEAPSDDDKSTTLAAAASDADIDAEVEAQQDEP